MDHLSVTYTSSDKAASLSKAVSSESEAGKLTSFMFCFSYNN